MKILIKVLHFGLMILDFGRGRRSGLSCSLAIACWSEEAIAPFQLSDFGFWQREAIGLVMLLGDRFGEDRGDRTALMVAR
ncbi:MAG: hypothetical protein F6K30_17745 [Cyanothece sp. SIO2G6]|nr:hypothetical protein [Cyanothece sp. SIO2G6]